jgi:cytochrome c biogenesis protein CcmG/thiol:disulfide interchange protein DsbE
MAFLALAAACAEPGCAKSALPPASAPAVQVRSEVTLAGDILAVPRAGRVTLVDFWSTACEPCKAMMPELDRLWRERKGQGLDVVGVACDDNPGLVSEHLRAMAIGYPNLVDADGKVRGAYRVALLPHSVVIDRARRVRLSVQGAKPGHVEQILDAVKAALQEEP